MKIKVKLYDIYIFLIVFLKGLGATSESKAYIIAFMFGCAAIALKIFQERFTVRELSSMIFILAVGVLTYLVGKETTVLFTAIALCGSKNVNSHRIIKLTFWSMLLAFLIMIVGSSTGVIENEVVRFWREDGYIYRNKFGYGHPNTAHIIFTILSFLFLYVYEEKVNVLTYFAILACNNLLFSFTYSRTGMIMTIVAVLLSAAIRFENFRKLFMRYFKYIYYVLFVVSIAVGLLYTRSAFVGELDELLSGRIRYTYEILTTQIPPLLGQLEYAGIMIDNSYIALIYHSGCLACIWFFNYILRSAQKLQAENRYNECYLLTCFAIYGLAESFFASISLNISLIFINEVLFSREGKVWKNLRSSHRRIIGGTK